MTYPPHDPSSSGPAGWDAAYQPAAPEEPPARKSRVHRRIAVGATVAGALVLGGAGYAVASFLSGAGPQPEEVLPGDTIAFVKLDLDPAAGQKAAMASLLDKFPALGDGTDDVRRDLVDQLLQAVGSDLAFDQDVEPWIGDRMAVGAVPDSGSDGGIAPVLVLAVDDQQEMADSLDSARDDLDLGFAVRDDFVLITQSQDIADRLAADDSSLAEDADYTGDVEALAGDQIAVAWADLSAAQNLLQSALPPAETGLFFGGEGLSGRVVLGLHAEDDTLELVGLDFTVSDAGVPGGEPTRLAQDLPEDALAAVSISGVGERAVTAWEEFAETGALEGMQQPLSDLGLDLPGDLRTILGSDLAVAVLGDPQSPAFGARVTTGDPQVAARLVADVLSSPELGVHALYQDAEGGYVVATDQATLDAMAADGGLGDTDAFRAAVADSDAATAVGYADLAALLEQLPDSGEEGFQPSDLAALDAVGFSATPTDEGSRFVLRITTR